MQERLQKIISRAGIASRRKAEELITAGEVVVNGERVTELGSKADPTQDEIVISGKKLNERPPRLVYVALNKPRGCVTTTDDPEGRPTVMDLLGGLKERVYPVGRLDFHSEGLLLLTNDGDLANHVLSAKSEIPKKYVVKVNGMLPGSHLEKFRRGIHLDDGKTAPAKIRMAKAGPNPWYEVTLQEGRNRQIRRMFQALGFQVEKIKRTEIGALKLGKMKPAEMRFLTSREVHWLLHPEDAPPETPRREKRVRSKVEPQKEERPTVRRTAIERREAGEKIDLRVHTEPEPPPKPGERRAGRPAVRKSSAGRGFRPAGGARPSRPRVGPKTPRLAGRGAAAGGPPTGRRPTVGPKSGDRSRSMATRGRPQGRDRWEGDGDDRPRSNERGPVRPPLTRPSGGSPSGGNRGGFGGKPVKKGFGAGRKPAGRPMRKDGPPRGPRGGR